MIEKKTAKWLAEWLEDNKDKFTDSQLSILRLSILGSNIKADIGSYMGFKCFVETEINKEDSLPSLDDFKLRFYDEISSTTSELSKNIVDVVKEYGYEIVKDKIICPFHEDSKPSLHIYQKTNSWYCFGCQQGGNVVKFISLKEKKPYKEILKELSPKEKILATTVKERSYKVAQKLMEEDIFITLEDTQEILYYKDGIYKAAESKIDKLARDILDEEASIHIINEIIGHIKGSTYISRKKFDINPYVICVENGILNLESGEIEEFSPDKYFLTKLPIIFNKEKDCPKINKFLLEILKEEHTKTILELFGYCLLRDYPFHKAFMFVGDGANGKSTLINLLKEFLGHENCSAIPLQDLDTTRFAVASLHRKLANLFADLPPKQLVGTGKFKMLTGQDIISGERKFKEHFTFKNYAKLIFSTNKVPKTKDDTTAFWRRWIMINFPNSFEGKKAEKRLVEKLTVPSELSGLLNLAIASLKSLISNGEFTGTMSTTDIKELYTRMSDSIGAFIMDCAEFDSESYIGKRELYSSYCEYCREKSYPTLNEQTFHKNLPQYLSVTQERIGKDRKYTWKGIKLSV